MANLEAARVECTDLLHKHVEDYDSLAVVIEGFRVLHRKVVVTIGTWDLLHIGHVRYLRNARNCGDLLVVGVDTDQVVKKTKGELRPVVPYGERIEMLAYQSCVDIITPIGDVDDKGNWQYGLVDRLKPDIFVAEEKSYSDRQLADIQERCRKLVILPRQAQGTSTSQMIQDTVKRHIDEMHRLLTKR